MVFVDDSYLQGNTYKASLHNIENRIELLKKLGFAIHLTKSILTPTQRITFLGFVIDPVQMTLEITEEKKSKIHNLCLETLEKEEITLRTLASVIGNFVASFPSASLGPFFYRNLEKQKMLGLKLHYDKMDTNITLNVESKKEIYSWKNNIFKNFAHLNIPDPDITIYTDASLTGCGITDDKTPTGGRWDEDEITHINLLELKTIQFGVLTYCKDKNFKHIRIMSDDTTTTLYINKKRGLESNECNKTAKEIWIWCTGRDLQISAAHIPGKENFEADKNSRKFQDEAEWQLNPKIYKAVCDTFGTPEIDLFASRINGKTEKYVTWKPEAFAVDAFYINWRHHFIYIFPPFSLLTKVIKKVCQDQANLMLRPDKTAVHPLAEKLMLHIIKFNTMVD